MGPEAGLRQRARARIRSAYPNALIVGQPANGMTGPGRHDLYVVVAGRYVGLEVKTSTGCATSIQEQRIRDTRRAGGYAWIVRSPEAAARAVHMAEIGAPMANDDPFDIDALLAGAPSEPKILDAALRNGVAGHDGEAIVPDASYGGSLLGPTEMPAGPGPSTADLLRAIDYSNKLLTRILDEMKTARQSRTAQDDEAEVTALLAGPVDPPTGEPPVKTRTRSKKPA